MRHLRSILYALVLAPAVWVLCGVGFTRELTGRAQESGGGVETLGAVLLVALAGLAYAILVFAPISPAGPALAGLVFLAVSGWALFDPSGYAGLWPAGVSKAGFDLSRPGYALAAMLAIPLLCTALSARRWERYEPPKLPVIGTLGRARGKAAALGTPVSVAETAVISTADTTEVITLPKPAAPQPDEDATVVTPPPTAPARDEPEPDGEPTTIFVVDGAGETTAVNPTVDLALDEPTVADVTAATQAVELPVAKPDDKEAGSATVDAEPVAAPGDVQERPSEAQPIASEATAEEARPETEDRPATTPVAAATDEPRPEARAPATDEPRPEAHAPATDEREGDAEPTTTLFAAGGEVAADDDPTTLLARLGEKTDADATTRLPIPAATVGVKATSEEGASGERATADDDEKTAVIATPDSEETITVAAASLGDEETTVMPAPDGEETTTVMAAPPSAEETADVSPAAEKAKEGREPGADTVSLPGVGTPESEDGEKTQVIRLRRADEVGAGPTRDFRGGGKTYLDGPGEQTQVIFRLEPVKQDTAHALADEEATRRRAEQAAMARAAEQQAARDRAAQERARQAFKDRAAQERARQAFADRAAAEARRRGEETQVINVIRPDAQADKTELLGRIPGETTVERPKKTTATKPPSIVGEERPDPGADPTTLLSQPSEKPNAIKRPHSMLDSERPPDESADDTSLLIPHQRDNSEES